MRVLLVDVDSKIPNLALMKISAWHKTLHDQVSCIRPSVFRGKRRINIHFYQEDPDLVYISCIFKENTGFAQQIGRMFPKAMVDIGGSGFNLTKTLPPEIEKIKPDYSLYPSEYSQGYTTRGCVRKCDFCIVPQKEGRIRVNQHPSEFHQDGFNTCMIMDNNLFAAPQPWQDEVFRWFRENKIKMLSPQGWDIRLLNEHRANLLKSIKHAGVIHFAWDKIETEDNVKIGIELLKGAGFKLSNHKISFYVLVGFDTTFEQDLYRCRKLKEWGVQAYVMRYKKPRTPQKEKELNALARWTNNNMGWFWAVDFNETDDGKKVLS